MGRLTEGRLRYRSAFEGMGAFSYLWLGQSVTLLGNSVLRFAFVVRAWDAGRNVSSVTLLAVCAVIPQILLSPYAGSLVDRLSRRVALQLADVGGGAVVCALAGLYFSGHLTLWEIYVSVLLISAAAAFQYPALSSTIPLLVSQARLQRANGLLSTAQSVATICGPALAAPLLLAFGLGWILIVDLFTFAWAVLTACTVRLPDEERAAVARAAGIPSVGGLRYLFARPSLRNLIIVFFAVNLVMVIGLAVIQPMVLARTAGNTAALAAVTSSTGIGAVAGGLLLAAWGGPKSMVKGMMLGIIAMCASAEILTAVLRGPIAWCATLFAGSLLLPIVNGTLQTLIQLKVPQEILGRVFGAVQFTTRLSTPAAMAAAGPLADRLFIPWARRGSGLVGLLQHLTGHGAGSGLAVMLLLAGMCGIGAAIWGLANRTLREIDTQLTDRAETATAAA